jgi:excisionase family DNA binding protein
MLVKHNGDPPLAAIQPHEGLAELPPVLTVPEAARVLRIGRRQAYEAVRSGQIAPTVRIGRRVLVPRGTIERLLTGAAR